MTWRKTGAEFDDQCAEVDLSDHAYRTHMEAIGHVYKTEAIDCRFNKTAMRRFATSPRVTDAVRELLDIGFWADRGTHYEVCHHGDVIVDSLEAQKAKRDRDRAAQQRARARKEQAGSSSGVSDLVSADTRQTDRQTDKHLEGGTSARQVCKHWVDVTDACTDCERKSA